MLPPRSWNQGMTGGEQKFIISRNKDSDTEMSRASKK